MPSYEYQDLVSGKTLSVEQRISDAKFTHYDTALKGFVRIRLATEAETESLPLLKAGATLKLVKGLHPVKRLISGAPAVQFISGPSGGWSSAGYALTPAQRKAEHKLGRKVTKRA